MLQAATIEDIVQRVRREGHLTKSAVLAAWPEIRDEYPLARGQLLREPGVIGGRKRVGGFRATAAVADEVAEAVRDSGYISRRGVRRRWQLRDQDYQAVRQAVLQSTDIDSGGGRGGGLRAKSPLDQQSGDPDLDLTIAPGIALLDWQRAAVEFISEALSRDELRRLVGPLAGTVRSAIQMREGTDRPSRKAELATALVLKHGRDLMRENAISAALATATNTPRPRRWHPGKASALKFVEQLGLPIEFAGEPAPERKPDFEYFEPRQTPVLQDFQREVQLELLSVLHRDRGRGIVTLPTGAGKTLVAVDTIRQWLTMSSNGTSGSAVLWLAHTEELCEQAYQCFAQVWSGSPDICGMYLFRFWGGYYA